MFAAVFSCVLAAAASCRAAEAEAGRLLTDPTPADRTCGKSVSLARCSRGTQREILSLDCAGTWRECVEAIPQGRVRFLADPGSTLFDERAGRTNAVTLGVEYRKQQRVIGVIHVVRPAAGEDHPRSDGEAGEWFYLSQGVNTAPVDVLGVAGETDAFLLLNLRDAPVKLDLTQVMGAQLPQCRSGVLVYDPFAGPPAIVDAARACADAAPFGTGR